MCVEITLSSKYFSWKSPRTLSALSQVFRGYHRTMADLTVLIPEESILSTESSITWGTAMRARA